VTYAAAAMTEAEIKVTTTKNAIFVLRCHIRWGEVLLRH